MKLSEYLKKERIQLQELCEKAEITRATLFNLMCVGRDVRGSVLAKIENATDGKVTCMELYKEYIEPRQSRNSIQD